MSKTLVIDVSLNRTAQDLNATYAKNPASTAAAAKVDVAGNIDVEDVADVVVISWNLIGETGVRFQQQGPNKTVFEVSPKNPGNPGQEPDGMVTLTSVQDRTLTVTDTNANSANPTPWNYKLYLRNGNVLDPSIINR